MLQEDILFFVWAPKRSWSQIQSKEIESQALSPALQEEGLWNFFACGWSIVHR
jgi:hypothetical protein